MGWCLILYLPTDCADILSRFSDLFVTSTYKSQVAEILDTVEDNTEDLSGIT